MIENQKIFITGGAGYLGRNIIDRYYNNNEITVYSRDEAKHYFLKKEFPHIKCIVGDVANVERMLRASRDHTIGIFAASMKQISAVDQNPEEGVKTIIQGAINSRYCAEENNMVAACFVSTDKSRAATTLYGSMKFVAGELFIIGSEDTRYITKLSSAIYGNVWNSTGSIIPLIWDSIKNDREITLYGEKMTRFMIDISQALDLIESALSIDGYNVIPMAKSFLVADLFDIYKSEFGLRYKIGSPRVSEKIHEIMVAKEEVPRTFVSGDNFLMHSKKLNEGPDLIEKEYSSKDNACSKEELLNILKGNGFFK